MSHTGREGSGQSSISTPRQSTQSPPATTSLISAFHPNITSTEDVNGRSESTITASNQAYGQACETCKVRKVKCRRTTSGADGGVHPCDACVKHGFKCTISLGPRSREKGASRIEGGIAEANTKAGHKAARAGRGPGQIPGAIVQRHRLAPSVVTGPPRMRQAKPRKNLVQAGDRLSVNDSGKDKRKEPASAEESTSPMPQLSLEPGSKRKVCAQVRDTAPAALALNAGAARQSDPTYWSRGEMQDLSDLSGPPGAMDQQENASRRRIPSYSFLSAATAAAPPLTCDFASRLASDDTSAHVLPSVDPTFGGPAPHFDAESHSSFNISPIVPFALAPASSSLVHKLDQILPRPILIHAVDTYFQYTYGLVPAVHRPSFMHNIRLHTHTDAGGSSHSYLESMSGATASDPDELPALILAVAAVTLVGLPWAFAPLGLDKGGVKRLARRCYDLAKGWAQNEFDQITTTRCVVHYQYVMVVTWNNAAEIADEQSSDCLHPPEPEWVEREPTGSPLAFDISAADA